MLGKRGADPRACPCEVLVCSRLDGVCNVFRRLRRLSEFAMKRIAGVEPGDRQVEHVLVEIPCTPLTLSLKPLNAGPQHFTVENGAEIPGFCHAIDGSPIKLTVNDRCRFLNHTRSIVSDGRLLRLPVNASTYRFKCFLLSCGTYLVAISEFVRSVA